MAEKKLYSALGNKTVKNGIKITFARPVYIALRALDMEHPKD